MAKKFMSFLGASKYAECYYKLGEMATRTRFIQEHLIRVCCQDWSEQDAAIIFTTDYAAACNWRNPGEPERNLADLLNGLDYKLQIKEVKIPDGKNKEEIWQIFDLMLSNIEDGDEIIFDITHSFRSIPMLAMVVLNYAKVVKNARIAGIYYGAYEARSTDSGHEVAPVFDLTDLDELLEWSQAINAFVRYGNINHLNSLAMNDLRPKLTGDIEAGNMKNFISALLDFNNSILTCRGKYLPGHTDKRQKSIAGAYKNMQQKLQRVRENNTIKALTPLLADIEKSTSKFDTTDNLKIGLAQIEWCIEKDLIQQAYTALDETMITYACRRYNYEETSKEREKVVTVALVLKGNKKPKSEWRVDGQYLEKIEELVEKLEEEYARLYNEVKTMRNDLNHFGFTNDHYDSNDFIREIKKLYESFRNYLERDGNNQDTAEEQGE